MIAWDLVLFGKPYIFEQEINSFELVTRISSSPSYPTPFIGLSVEGEVLIGQRPGHHSMLPQTIVRKEGK